MPLATSVRALAALQRDGLVERIGLCNVTRRPDRGGPPHRRDRRRQVELSSGRTTPCSAAWSSTASHQRHPACSRIGRSAGRAGCAARSRDAALRGDRRAPRRVARRDRAGVADRPVALASCRLPGATRVETAAIARARPASSSPTRTAPRSTQRFPSGRGLRASTRRRSPPRSSDGEVVLIMGLPGGRQEHAARSVRGAGIPARSIATRRGGTLRELAAARSTARSRPAPADRPRQHLRDAQVARGGHPGGRGHAAYPCAASGCRPASRTRRSTPRGACLAIREAARRRRAECALRRHDVAPFGRRCSSATSASWSRPTAVRRLLAHRHDPLRAPARSVVRQSRRDSLVRRRAAAQPVRASRRRRQPRMSRSCAGARDSWRYAAAEGFRLLGMSWQPEIADGAQSRAEVDAVFARMRELLRLIST